MAVIFAQCTRAFNFNTYEPYTIIKTNKFIGLFPFDGNGFNTIPLGSNDNANRCGHLEKAMLRSKLRNNALTKWGVYCLYILNRLMADLSQVNTSSDGVEGWSVFLNGASAVNVPLTVNPASFPLLTIGAWIKPSNNDLRTQDPRYTLYYILFLIVLALKLLSFTF